MIIGIVIVWIVTIFLSILWVNLIDRAVSNDEWEKYRQEEYRQEEDRQQEEYIKEYNRKRAEKERRKKQARDKVLGIMADVVTAVCTAITKFLLWIQRKGR